MQQKYVPIRAGSLLPLVLLYGAASLIHFSHNAEFLSEYPNLPAWFTRAGVYGAWVGVTAIGVVGYLLLRARYARTGLLLLVVYGAFGLDGLSHYALAPPSAHTWTMNFTIGFEAVMGGVLIAAVVVALFRSRSGAMRNGAA